MYQQYDYDLTDTFLMNNRLFCTFTPINELDNLISGLTQKYDIMYNKMFVLLDAPTQEDLDEESKGLYYNVNKRKKAGTSRDASHPKAPTAQAWKDAAKTAKKESVAGPEKCWPGHRKVGTKPGTGKNAGKRVNDCEKIGEATSAAQQAAIAIAKKKAGKK